jgi:hypothetical protein
VPCHFIGWSIIPPYFEASEKYHVLASSQRVSLILQSLVLKSPGNSILQYDVTGVEVAAGREATILQEQKSLQYLAS